MGSLSDSQHLVVNELKQTERQAEVISTYKWSEVEYLSGRE